MIGFLHTVMAAAQGLAAPQVAWHPRLPLQGSLVVVGVRLSVEDSAQPVHGELGGEPLHFEVVDGWLRALAGVPLDTGDSLAGHVVIERADGGADTVRLMLPVGPRRARRERLRTNPDFVQPPDSLTARIEAERVLVREIKLRAHDTPRLWHGPFVRPRPGPVTSGFGTARVYNGIVRSRHMGVDFAGRTGSPVHVANHGVVAFVGDLYFSGTTVLVDHGAGLISAYLHLSSAAIAAGDTVVPGQLVGRVGSSGRVTGPHLHWLASYGNVMVNPMDLLRLDLDAPLTPTADWK